MPGGVHTLEELLHQGIRCVDNVTGVPVARWDSLEGFGEALRGQRSGFGAMVHGAQCFDNVQFRISVAETVSMDPAQRLILETAYHALHAGAFDRARLIDHNMGVLLGVDKCDWFAVRDGHC